MYRGKSKPPFAPNALAAMVAALTTGSVLAQDNADFNYRLSEEELVVVGTQKRDQDMMEVPIAVDALGSTDLKETGALLLGEIADYTPGFKFSKDDVVQGGATMRGISSSNISTGGDPSVAVFFDDVYMPRAAQSVPFTDIERIEILKGPQGTLFGKNAAAGVVHIVPNAPKMEKQGFVSMRLGDYGQVRGETMLNLPINDSTAFRINALSDQRDSYIENVNDDYDGEELGNRNQKAVRASLLKDITTRTSVQFAVDWNDLDQGYKANIGVSPYAYSMDPGSRKMASDVQDGHETRDMTGYSMKVNHEFSPQWSTKFVTSYRTWEVSGRDDTDGTADITRYVDTINYEDSDIFYNELQVNFSNDRINAVGGITYSVEDIYQKTSINVTADTVTRLTTGGLNEQLIGGLTAAGLGPEQIAGYGLPMDHIWNPVEWATALMLTAEMEPSVGALFQALGLDPTSESFPEELVGAIVNSGDLTYDLVSGQLGIPEIIGPSYSGQFWGEDVVNTGKFVSTGFYSDVDVQLTDSWGFAAGIRYSSDEKDFSWEITERTLANNNSLTSMVAQLYPLLDELNANKTWDKLTGRALLRYSFADGMVYTSYSTGYKAGGFDSLNPATAADPFEPESISDVELGYKGTLFNSLRVQANLYQMDVTDRQEMVFSQLPGSAALVPLVINGDQSIFGAEMILDWHALESWKLGLVTEFRDTDSEWEPFYNSQGVLTTEESSASSATSFTLTSDWSPDWELAGGFIKWHVDYVYEENVAEDSPDLHPVAYQIPGYFNDTEVLNTRLSWQSAGGRFEAALWGQNLTDNTTVGPIEGLAAEILGTPTVTVSNPRTIGIDFRYNFF